jgi:hypothetical protein
MTLLKRAGTAALIATTFALGASAATMSAHAAPAAANAVNGRIVSTNSDITKVQGMDRRHRGYYDYGYNPGAYLGLGIAGAILDGALSDGTDGYAEGPGYSEGSSTAMRHCAAQFRSFEWDTGLYTTYDGDKRLCPYLG